ncbi:uncharacterized protein LAJ45_02477 [Morchella importuna]|uniref:uncharacterized protein n=1 Tax=Morchella importuna TaxID=1174673 RepID=UPI001E8E0CCE|nr:uncharacterized protein LAJ45_02477 [Morchella importuna]KAH8153664.1 hypothetical protein LAJ45_02477 [Morchella importuna]
MPSSHALKHASDVTTFVTDQALYTKTLCGAHNAKPIHPLWFSQVCGGSNTGASLLQLPSELLDHITELLSIADLASMALVNTACRQLARSRQFANIHLSYTTPEASGIRNVLADESAARMENPMISSPTLGVCVRSLTVASVILMDSFFVRWWKLEDLPSLFMPEVSRERAIELVANNYFDVYVRNLSDALRYVLPNLEILRWEDKVCITPELMNAITASGVRELEMAGVFVDREFVVDERPRWGLRGLVMDIQRAKGCRNVNTAPLCMSILKAAAQTLEELEWVNGEVTRFDAAEFDPPLRFPQLRSLVLQNTEIDSELLEALISENNPQLRLRILTVASSSASEYLSRRGHIDTLQVYHTLAPLSPSDAVFIGANSQLHKLTAPCASDSLVLGTLLPTLTDFRHLTNLYLVWDSKTIDIRALESIGGVKSLTHLWLSAGTQSGNIHDWVAPHDAMVTAFCQLQKLRVLVFTRDTYEQPLAGEPPEKYYILRQHPDGVEGDEGTPGFQQRSEAAWELWHVEEMRRVASDYADVLERLELVFLGQLEANVRQEWWKEPGKRIDDWCFGKAKSRAWVPSGRDKSIM